MENKELNQDIENLKNTVERYKTLSLALVALFVLSLVALVISLITSQTPGFLVAEKLYILVMAVSFVCASIFIILFIKNKNKLKKLNK